MFIYINHLFRSEEIGDDAMNYLGQGLHHFTHLEEISLNFSGCQDISDHGFDQLCKGLQTVASLKSLALIFEK